jgi:hypothetical protein
VGDWTHARRRAWLLAGLVAFVVGVRAAGAQELEPRAYSPAPIGTSFLLAGFGRSEGGILFDPSLDIDHVEADLWITTLGAGHTFALAGRQARVLAVVPIASGDITGDVGSQSQRQDLVGLADPRFKFSIGLLGAPARSREEFTRASRGPVLGACVTVMAPWGQYDPTQLVNLGYNRWGIKPEIGLSVPRGRWTLDAYVGTWFFTVNDDYFPGQGRKHQDAVFTVQGHVNYALPRGQWISVNGTWFAGGETRIGRIVNPDLQRNTRFGVTWSLPVTAQQSLKFTYSTGTSTRRGSDFNTLNVTWQLVIL